MDKGEMKVITVNTRTMCLLCGSTVGVKDNKKGGLTKMAKTIELNGFTYDLETPTVVVDGVSYSAASFTEEETKRWDSVFKRLTSGDDEVSELIKEFQSHLFAADRVAKMVLLSEQRFGGTAFEEELSPELLGVEDE